MTATAGVMDFAIRGAGWYAGGAYPGSCRMAGDTGGSAADGSTVVRLGKACAMTGHAIIGRSL